MPPAAVAKLFEKMKVRERREEASEEEAEESEEELEEETEEAVANEAEVEGVVEVDVSPEEGASGDHEQLRQRIHGWARRAAEGARLVARPEGPAECRETTRL